LLLLFVKLMLSFYANAFLSTKLIYQNYADKGDKIYLRQVSALG
jgi:hypothetical protein